MLNIQMTDNVRMEHKQSGWQKKPETQAYLSSGLAWSTRWAPRKPRLQWKTCFEKKKKQQQRNIFTYMFHISLCNILSWIYFFIKSIYCVTDTFVFGIPLMEWSIVTTFNYCLTIHRYLYKGYWLFGTPPPAHSLIYLPLLWKPSSKDFSNPPPFC